MKSPRLRRLAFELLEPKSSPSALLLALAPLEEPDQRAIESDRTMYASTHAVHEANAALLKFIEWNTQEGPKPAATIALPTREETSATDKMIQATDTDLRTTLITELLDARSAGSHNENDAIQF
jgi:hypothetical protein